MACEDDPVLVDCDFEELPVTTDPLGNPVVQFCPPDSDTFPPVTPWDSNGEEGATPQDDPCIEGFYFDVHTQCISHYCSDGVLYPFCSVSTDPDPVMVEVCYDLSILGPGPYCFGGESTGWIVDGVNRYQPDCYDPNATSPPVATFTAPSIVQVNPDYSESSGMSAPQADLPGLYAGATDSGQTSTVTVSGDPNVSPYFGAPRPTVFIDHGANDPECVGPLCFRFTNTVTSGAIGFAMWHRPTNTFADITWSSAPGSSLASYQDDGFGDYVVFNTSGSSGGLHQLCYGNTAGNPASEYTMIVFALGGNQPDPIEQLDGVEFEYQRVATGGDTCCECHTAATLAAVMTTVDPTPGVQQWSATGSLVCAMVPVGEEGSYGALSFCEGSILPVDQTDPPVFVSAPPSEVCVDDLLTECAECVGGIVTAQELISGSWAGV